MKRCGVCRREHDGPFSTCPDCSRPWPAPADDEVFEGFPYPEDDCDCTSCISGFPAWHKNSGSDE